MREGEKESKDLWVEERDGREKEELGKWKMSGKMERQGWWRESGFLERGDTGEMYFVMYKRVNVNISFVPVLFELRYIT